MKHNAKLGWYAPMDRWLERVLEKYMTFEVWAFGIGAVLALVFWLTA